MENLNAEQVKKWLEVCAEDTPYPDQRQALLDTLSLIKQLTEENESLGIENEVQRLNLGNTRDDLNNAECDVARLKRENTALEREVERLKADAVPRREVEKAKQDVLREVFEKLGVYISQEVTIDLKEEAENYRQVIKEFAEIEINQTKQDVAREIFEEIYKLLFKHRVFAMIEDYNDLKKKYIGE